MRIRNAAILDNLQLFYCKAPEIKTAILKLGLTLETLQSSGMLSDDLIGSFGAMNTMVGLTECINNNSITNILYTLN